MTGKPSRRMFLSAAAKTPPLAAKWGELDPPIGQGNFEVLPRE